MIANVIQPFNTECILLAVSRLITPYHPATLEQLKTTVINNTI